VRPRQARRERRGSRRPAATAQPSHLFPELRLRLLDDFDELFACGEHAHAQAPSALRRVSRRDGTATATLACLRTGVAARDAPNFMARARAGSGSPTLRAEQRRAARAW
jgi:hypothetical protein